MEKKNYFESVTASPIEELFDTGAEILINASVYTRLCIEYGRTLALKSYVVAQKYPEKEIILDMLGVKKEAEEE